MVTIIRRILWLALLILSVRQVLAQEALTLEQAIRTAFEHSPDLKREEAELARARGEKQSLAALLPSPPKIGVVGETDAAFANEGEYALAASLSQELEIGGQRGLRRKLGSLEFDKATQRLEWTRQQVRLEVKQAFYRLLYLQEKETVFARLAGSNRELARLASMRAAQGTLTAFDRNLWTLEDTTSDAELKGVEAEQAEARRVLAQLLGSDDASAHSIPAIPGRVSGVWPSQFQLPSKEELLSLALSDRADLKQLALDMEQKDAAYRLAKRARLPNPELSVGYARGRDKIGQDEFNGDPAVINGISGATLEDEKLLFGLSIPLPMFSGQKGEIAKAKADAQKGAYEKAALERRIAQEVDAFYTRLFLSQDVVARYQKQNSIDADLSALNTAYQRGNVDVATFLNYRDRLIRAKLDMLDAKWALVEALTSLELASGKNLEGNL